MNSLGKSTECGGCVIPVQVNVCPSDDELEMHLKNRSYVDELGDDFNRTMKSLLNRRGINSVTLTVGKKDLALIGHFSHEPTSQPSSVKCGTLSPIVEVCRRHRWKRLILRKEGFVVID